MSKPGPLGHFLSFPVMAASDIMLITIRRMQSLSMQMVRGKWVFVGKELFNIGMIAINQGFPKIDHSSINARIVLEQNKIQQKSYL